MLPLITIFSMYVFAQSKKDVSIPSLNEAAPAFTAISTQGEVKYPNDFYNKWVIIFSHPADFTPVCTTEIWELAHHQDEFANLNTKLIVISTDGLNSHLEWIKSIESLEYKGMKPTKIKFPLISDVNMSISKMYGMQHPYENSTQNVRGIFIISPKGYIQYIAFYPSYVGRNINEIIRVLTALQESYVNDVLTPVNWQKGDDYLLLPPKSIEMSEKMKEKNDPNFYNYNWYMWFKKNNK